MNGEAPGDIRRTRAEVRRSWWPGWIWAVPIAALLLVGWWLVHTFVSAGESITISFADVHGLSQSDGKVVYRGMKVGDVKSAALAKDGKSIDVTVRMDDDVSQFLRSGTQFWLRGAHPSLANPSALSSIVSGPTIVMEPGPGDRTTRFVGMERQPIVSRGHGTPVIYRAELSGGAVGQLSVAAPIKLRGFTVGEVKEVGFRYDAKTGSIETPVTLALYPALFHVDDADSPASDTTLATAIDRMIGKGLRVRLERDPPVIGDPQLTLDFAPSQTGAVPPTIDGMRQLPVDSGGGINSIVDQVNKLPLDQIAQNVLDATQHVNALVGSPAIADAVTQLDATLTQLHQTSGSAGPKITELVDRLTKTAEQIDSAASAAQKTAVSAAQTASAADRVLGGGAPSQTDMRNVMRELAEAARSVRELADYLTQHPEALIKGRTGG